MDRVHNPPTSNPSMEPNLRLKCLTQLGDSIEIDATIPARRYFRSGLEMIRMANCYSEEGNFESAFIIYMKFIVLFLEKIRNHPDLSSVSAVDREVNKQKLKEVLPVAEKIKSKLLTRFTEEHEQYKREAEQRRFLEEKARREEIARQEKELADKLSALELKGATNYHKQPPYTAKQDSDFIVPISPSDISYPKDPDLLDEEEQYSTEDYDKISPVTQKYPVPDRSLKPSKLEIPTSSILKPNIDRSTKPLSLLSPSLHNQLGLRKVIIPSKLLSQFMSLAQKNTDQNIETCGILAGSLNKNQLQITHLLVPKQNGTPDSCTTMSEEEIFDFQDQHDLITFGWIHTHPSQTSFLSSVDLHTHCSYQRMMPEAIAIVCAPRYKETGIYMLTTSYGLDFIANCRSTGFHPHPSEPPLFTTAEHAMFDELAPINVVDLRR
ncbi:STAM-binding protein [Neocloeon triangulifer]|uniref:STAM-binding protein n=1 Tax=Neocloeon triangulifer TaxID=2078957 RepID=UPI00286F8061|nr:STAM-binding protein [Neocloeon triangulifer]